MMAVYIWVCASLAFLVSGPLSGQGVVAALVKPWGNAISGTVGAVWSDLSVNWANYGSTPLSLNTTSFVGGSTAVTLAALNAVNPDVLVFANSGGGNFSFTPAEQADIASFLTQGGKRAVATYAAFFHNNSDNRWLMPYFGLDPNLTLMTTPHGGIPVLLLEPQHSLATGLPASYLSSGYASAHVPVDSSWDLPDYIGVLVAADTSNRQIVHYYGASSHDSVFISFMPEYGGQTLDRQLLYNAMALRVDLPRLIPSGIPNIGTIFGISISAPAYPFESYVVAFSASTSPRILLPDNRVIPLTPDSLFILSLAPASPYFSNTTGLLDGNGMAANQTLVAIPQLPSLINVTIYAAVVTSSAMSPIGIGGISSALPITFFP